jgi:hypothetical protein
MSILDDAIREHLELKRAHGADDAELKKLEDEAFGPPARPAEHDPFAEAPTEFLVAPEVGAGEQADDEPSGRRVPNIADLQEAPEPAGAPEPAEAPSAEEPQELDGPAEEEHPAMEHETIPEPPPPAEPETEAEIDAGHSTEERHAIADQPTEIFDVQGQFEDAATEAESLSDDELVDAEMAEPRLAPVDPLAGIDGGATGEPEITREAEPAAEEAESEDEFDEFFSEQRLSDELNQALEAPLEDDPTLAPAEEAEEVTEVTEVEEAEELEEEGEDPAAEEPAPPAPGHEDVLEDTPDFLEDAPEDDNLWFEQKPPKDIDFGD